MLVSTAALGGEQLGVPLVERGLGLGRRADQLGRARLLELGQPELGQGLVELGLCAVGRRLVGARIDDEQDLARLDELAVPELDLLHVARDAGADLDLLHRLEAAGELVVLRQATHERGSDRDRRGGGWGSLGLPGALAVAARRSEQRDGQHERGERRAHQVSPFGIHKRQAPTPT